ncbi:uncharacterized protein [Diadema antillarum]|uniref:uncharacterized protein n=1 Tax=Diadema antillarum TaxID=105358 RepID=UPI003A8AF7FF
MCCRCCSFESVDCRLRTLKASGAFLIILGIIFALAGIAIAFFIDSYVTLPDVMAEYYLYFVLVTTTGIAAVVTGLGAIHMAKTWSDDGCVSLLHSVFENDSSMSWYMSFMSKITSTRGLSILALLTIVCSLAAVGLPAWQLYEGGYFVEIPARFQNSSTTTTSVATTAGTTVAMTVGMTSEGFSNSTSNETTTGAINGTNANMTSMMNVTTMGMDMMNDTTTTMMNDTTTAMMNDTTTAMMNDTMMNSNASSTNMPEAMSTANAMTTPFSVTDSSTIFSNSTMNGTMTTSEPYVPLDFDVWFSVIVPFGIVCFFTAFFIIFAMLVCCISCCCPGRSEIVKDNEIYKT